MIKHYVICTAMQSYLYLKTIEHLDVSTIPPKFQAHRLFLFHLLAAVLGHGLEFLLLLRGHPIVLLSFWIFWWTSGGFHSHAGTPIAGWLIRENHWLGGKETVRKPYLTIFYSMVFLISLISLVSSKIPGFSSLNLKAQPFSACFSSSPCHVSSRCHRQLWPVLATTGFVGVPHATSLIALDLPRNPPKTSRDSPIDFHNYWMSHWEKKKSSAQQNHVTGMWHISTLFGYLGGWLIQLAVAGVHIAPSFRAPALVLARRLPLLRRSQVGWQMACRNHLGNAEEYMGYMKIWYMPAGMQPSSYFPCCFDSDWGKWCRSRLSFKKSATSTPQFLDPLAQSSFFALSPGSNGHLAIWATPLPRPRLAAHVVAPVVPGLAVCGEVGRVRRGDWGVQLDGGAALQAGETHLGPMGAFLVWWKGAWVIQKILKVGFNTWFRYVCIIVIISIHVRCWSILLVYELYLHSTWELGHPKKVLVKKKVCWLGQDSSPEPTLTSKTVV